MKMELIYQKKLYGELEITPILFSANNHFIIDDYCYKYSNKNIEDIGLLKPPNYGNVGATTFSHDCKYIITADDIPEIFQLHNKTVKIMRNVKISGGVFGDEINCIDVNLDNNLILFGGSGYETKANVMLAKIISTNDAISEIDFIEKSRTFRLSNEPISYCKISNKSDFVIFTDAGQTLYIAEIERNDKEIVGLKVSEIVGNIGSEDYHNTSCQLTSDEKYLFIGNNNRIIIIEIITENNKVIDLKEVFYINNIRNINSVCVDLNQSFVFIGYDETIKILKLEKDNFGNFISVTEAFEIKNDEFYHSFCSLSPDNSLLAVWSLVGDCDIEEEIDIKIYEINYQ